MRILLGLALALLLATSVTSARAEGRVGPDYVLGPDDVIVVTVSNHPDLNQTLTILSDGTISFPEVGEVVAAGKTPRQFGAELQAALAKMRNNVGLVVAVKEANSRRVRAVGAVKNPNAYVLKPNWRLMDLVAVAGGFIAKPALITGNLIRTSSKVLSLNVARAMAQPDGPDNPVLQVDDLAIFEQVDQATRQVHVIGEVAKPGAFDLQDGTNLVSLISQAGSPTDKAALSQSYVLRGTTKIPLDLRRIFVEGKGREALTTVVLQPGDALIIPQVEDQFAVMGAVRQPGYFPVSERREMNVLNALSMAGGQLEGGDLAKVGVIRMVNGKAAVTSVNVEAMFKKRDLAANMKIEANDIVFVPTKGRRAFGWSDITAPLYALSLLGLVR